MNIVNKIREAFKLIDIKFGDNKIELRGTKSNIRKFKREPTDDEVEEYSLYYFIRDFNQYQVSSKIVKIDNNRFNFWKDFPGIFFKENILTKIKKVKIYKLLDLSSSAWYKLDIFTSKVVQAFLTWYLTLCTEVTWNIKVTKNF